MQEVGVVVGCFDGAVVEPALVDIDSSMVVGMNLNKTGLR